MHTNKKMKIKAFLITFLTLISLLGCSGESSSENISDSMSIQDIATENEYDSESDISDSVVESITVITTMNSVATEEISNIKSQTVTIVSAVPKTETTVISTESKEDITHKYEEDELPGIDPFA